MYNLEIKEVFKQLNTSSNGLKTAEAQFRLKQNGRNEIKEDKKPSFIKRFFKQFLNIMVGILLVSSVVSISVAIVNKEYADLFEGFVILFIVIMNAFIGVFQENKAEACLNDLKKYDKLTVKVIRSGVEIKIDSTELVVGDVIEMEAGDIVPADIRLFETNNFSCDESSLTGESESVDKNIDVILNGKIPLAERKNMAFSGCLVTRGKSKGVVTATGKNTEIGNIANLLFASKKEITPLQKSINKIGKVITYVVLAVCFIILSIELISGNSVVDALMPIFARS